MSTTKENKKKDQRILVEHPSGHRPFMRGIMVHSLMERGVPYEDAYRIARAVRDRISDRRTVSRDELKVLIEKELGDCLPSNQVTAKAVSPPNITIIGKGRIPFSKGFLSQSLLASAIDPGDAFDVAQEIELEILRSGEHEIDRQDLRELTRKAIRRRVGEEAEERYLVWREFQDPERPVIVLLGGATGVGKTSLAVEVAHRLGIHRVLSSDSIRQIMRIMLSPELMPAIHASSYDAYRTNPVNPVDGRDPVVESFLQQASVVSVGVQAMMDRAVEENTSMILDGVSIVPGLIDLERYQDTANVIFLMIATLDEESFRSRFEARAKDQVRRKLHRYIENLGSVLKIQNYLMEVADLHDVPVVHNQSFDRSVLAILRHVTGRLGKNRSAASETASSI